MHVRWLELVGFRNYTRLHFTPDRGLNVLTGDNGQGKTSLLEALHVLVAGRSFRTGRLGECIGWDVSLARVSGEVSDGAQSREIHLTLTPRPGGVDVQGDPCAWMRAVTFAGSDLGLLTAGPGVRRAYLDGATGKLAPVHAEVCRRYRLVVQQRTRLLPQLAGRPDAERLLAPWDEQLASLGSVLVHRRLDTLAALGREAAALGRLLSPREAEIGLTYVPTVAPGDTPAATRAHLLEALAVGRRRELQRRLTLVGPHRDDVGVRLGRADAHREASRGEQRLVTVALRLAEAAAVRQTLGRPPVFLLDDVLSELDSTVRERLVQWLSTQGQVVFSTTDAVPEAAGGAVWEVRRAEVAEAIRAPAREVA